MRTCATARPTASGSVSLAMQAARPELWHSAHRSRWPSARHSVPSLLIFPSLLSAASFSLTEAPSAGSRSSVLADLDSRERALPSLSEAPANGLAVLALAGRHHDDSADSDGRRARS